MLCILFEIVDIMHNYIYIHSGNLVNNCFYVLYRRVVCVILYACVDISVIVIVCLFCYVVTTINMNNKKPVLC